MPNLRAVWWVQNLCVKKYEWNEGKSAESENGVWEIAEELSGGW